ncbi:DUF6115 domain-containing protein [Brevibacillus migulae]|uniref:DUF6115 domain-containing protein n=1 Tax=Brevibacillus migulae TaxID=1644114 RepID=UPI00106E9FE3|nr:RNA polymerase subunit sigma-70 [Brevibacillus migulae]
MEQSYYLLLGAGALIMIAALFLKKSSSASAVEATTAVNRQADRAEMEKALQRFVKQVKDENDRLSGEVRATRQELQQLIATVEARVQTAEMMITQLSSNMASPTVAVEHAEESPATEDTLALQERYSRVFELKKEGLTVDEIAKRLGAGRGEIELIFSLASPSERGSAHEA